MSRGHTCHMKKINVILCSIREKQALHEYDMLYSRGSWLIKDIISCHIMFLEAVTKSWHVTQNTMKMITGRIVIIIMGDVVWIKNGWKHIWNITGRRPKINLFAKIGTTPLTGRPLLNFFNPHTLSRGPCEPQITLPPFCKPQRPFPLAGSGFGYFCDCCFCQFRCQQKGGFSYLN